MNDPNTFSLNMELKWILLSLYLQLEMWIKYIICVLDKKRCNELFFVFVIG